MYIVVEMEDHHQHQIDLMNLILMLVEMQHFAYYYNYIVGVVEEVMKLIVDQD